MKNRIFQKWTFQRALIAVAGSGLILFSLYDRMWPGLFLGGYILSMGVLNIGFARKTCYGSSCEDPALFKAKS